MGYQPPHPHSGVRKQAQRGEVIFPRPPSWEREGAPCRPQGGRAGWLPSGSPAPGPVLSRSFGIQHDGSGNDCEPIGKRPFIMSPQLLYDAAPLTWSHCSREYITRFLE